MLKARNEYRSFFTPRGEVIYPALDEPDYKFKKDTGEFHVRLRLTGDEPELVELLAEAQELLDAAYEAKKAQLTKERKGALLKELKKVEPILKPEVVMETGEETGFVILRASLGYQVNIKNGPKSGTTFYKNPDVFDARGKQLKNRTDRDGKILDVRIPKVGSGSTLKLNVTPQDYEADGGKTIGVRFELNAAQIIKLVQGGQRSASGYGFGVEEDGDAIDEMENSGGFGDESGDAPFDADNGGGSGRDF